MTQTSLNYGFAAPEPFENRRSLQEIIERASFGDTHAEVMATPGGLPEHGSPG